MLRYPKKLSPAPSCDREGCRCDVYAMQTKSGKWCGYVTAKIPGRFSVLWREVVADEHETLPAFVEAARVVVDTRSAGPQPAR